MDHRTRRVGIGRQTLLDLVHERRPEQRPVDAHLPHQREARLGIEEGVDAGHRDELAEADRTRRAGVTARLGVLRDVEPGTTGDGDAGEGRVRHVLRDPVLDRQLGAAVDVDVADDPLVLGWEELRQCVARLVEVVVGVERAVGQLPTGDLDELVVGHRILLSESWAAERWRGRGRPDRDAPTWARANGGAVDPVR